MTPTSSNTPTPTDTPTLTPTPSNTPTATATATNTSTPTPSPILFSDNGENGSSAWVVSGTWGLTTETAHSGQSAWSDSPNGDYAPNSVSTLTLANPIALPANVAARLIFWDPLDLGTGDHAYVEISNDNGGTWNVLRDYCCQTNVAWTRQVVDLSAYKGQNILIRFRLQASRNRDVGDGWHIDDVLITTTPETIFELPFTDNAENTLHWITEGTWGVTTNNPYEGATSFFNGLLRQTNKRMASPPLLAH